MASENDTTPKDEGVSAEGEQPRKPTNTRLEVMQRAAANRRKDLGLSEVSAETENLDTGREEAAKPAPQKPEQIADGEGEVAPPVYLKNGVWMTKRKVNGVEEEIEFNRLLATNQKDAAADAKLRQAAEAEKRLREREAQIRAEEQRRVQQKPAEPDPNVKLKLKEIRDKKFDAIYDGDKELASKLQDEEDALTQRLYGRSAEQFTIDPNKIAEQAAERVRRDEGQRRLTTAVNRFFAEKVNEDIAKDETLYRLVDQRSVEVANEHPDWEPFDILNESAKRVREWVRERAGSGTTLDHGARQARKRDASGVVPKATDRRAEAPEPPQPRTRAQAIEEMKRARGQSV